MLSVIEVIIIVLIFYFLLLIFNKKKRITSKLPGPWNAPLVGYYFQLTNRPHLKLYALSQKYGEIFFIRVGNRDAVVLNGHDTIIDALCNNSISFAGRPDLVFFEFITMKGGFTFMNYCPEMRIKRKVTNKAIHAMVEPRSHSADYAKNVSQSCKILAEQFRLHLNKPYDPKDDIGTLVCRLLNSFCFGEWREKLDEEYNLFTKGEDQFNQITTFNNFLNSFSWIMKPLFRLLSVFASRDNDIIDNFLIKKFKQTLETNSNLTVCKALYDEIKNSSLLIDDDNDKHFALTLMLTLDILGAGIGTTTQFLHFVFLYLIAFPEWQTKIQQEIDHAVPKSEQVTMDYVNKLPLLKSFLLEIKRYSCFAPFGIYRNVIKDVVFRSYFIPQNTLIIPNIYSAHFDERVWKDPHKFDPTRFLTEAGTIDINLEAKILLFGAGRRRCIGQYLADKNSASVIAYILQRFSFKPEPGFIPDVDSYKFGTVNTPIPFKLLINER